MVSQSHAIVGDGITALAFLEACIGRGFATITVIGKTASQLGRGIAYAKGEDATPWRFAYLLNSPADDIDPDFAVWLSDNWTKVVATMTDRKPDWLRAAAPLVERGDIYGVNAPREFYGDYMEERARKTCDTLTGQGTTLVILDDVATAIHVTDQSVTLQTQSGREITAQSVDIAPGGPETMRFDGDDGPFSVPSLFGYEHRIAEHITSGAEIFCIGGNASMLDVLRLCQSHLPNDAVRFAFCAPEGEIPPPLVPKVPRKLTKPALSVRHPSAESFLAEIRREIDAAEAAGDERREIRAGFRAHFLQYPLHTFLADPLEAAQVSRTLRFWLRGGTRDTIFDMRKLHKSGHVRLLKGRALSVENTPSGAIVHVEDGEGTRHAHKTDFVVNCAGAGPHSRFDPLTETLLKKGMLSTSAAGGLRVRNGCQTDARHVRYLSPAVTQIGDEVVAMPLYDAHMLRTYVARATQGAFAAQVE